MDARRLDLESAHPVVLRMFDDVPVATTIVPRRTAYDVAASAEDHGARGLALKDSGLSTQDLQALGVVHRDRGCVVKALRRLLTHQARSRPLVT